jgi:hypothetical protein
MMVSCLFLWHLFVLDIQVHTFPSKDMLALGVPPMYLGVTGRPGRPPGSCPISA